MALAARGRDVDTRFRGYDGKDFGGCVDAGLRGYGGVGVAGFCLSLPRRRESMALVWCGRDVDTRFRGYDEKGFGGSVDAGLRGYDGKGGGTYPP